MRLPLISTLLLSLIALSGCNGTSGDNGDDPFNPDNPSIPTVPVVAINVAILDANCEAVDSPSFTIGETLCIRATLTEDDATVSGEVINFTAGLGTLSVDSKLTDGNGVAEVMLSSNDATAGAATITAAFGSDNGTASYEFIADDSEVPTLPSVTLSMTDTSGNVVNRFKADDEVTLNVVLASSDSTPIPDEIITFQVDRGVLVVTNALTDSEGRASVVLAGDTADLGAATATAQATLEDTLYLDALNFEIQSPDAISEETVKLGHFNDSGEFVDGEIGTSIDEISAGGTLGLNVAVVTDVAGEISRVLSPTLVTFTSNCVLSGDANIDQEVLTLNGEANTTYEDISCAGGSGNTDVISASISVNNATLAITKNIDIAAESLGAIEFVSADPASIVLLGTGGQGSESVSTVTFQVNGSLGNPLSQQTVNFSLNTETGGLNLSPTSGLTNSQGQVSTRVTAGNVPTSVRVTATTEKEDGSVIQTQSDLLSVNTGLPDQNSMTLSASDLNPEAFNINGQQVTVTASLADTFNNPVPDGTAVSFTTEGGFIEPSCVTTGGICSVTWTSANPRPTDHRVTILATAVGHETLVDSNGNNVFDDNDKPAGQSGAIDIDDGSGFSSPIASVTGFIDLPEAWRDDDEDRIKDDAEVFLDFDGSGDYSDKNDAFDGPQCQATSNCSDLNSLHVRKAMVLIMSSSSAVLDLQGTNGGAAPTVIARGTTTTYVFQYEDTAGQPIASTSTIDVTTTGGTLGGITSDIMPQTNRAGARSLVFTLANELGDGDDSVDVTLTMSVTSPSGVVSVLTHVVTLN